MGIRARRFAWIALIAFPLLLATRAAASDALDPVRELIRQGKYAAAIEAGRARLAELGAEPSPDSLRIGAALDVLVESLWRGGKSGQAETSELATLAVGIRERRFGADAAELVVPLTLNGWVLTARGRYDAARVLIDRAVAICEKRLGPDDPAITETFAALGELQRYKVDYAGAQRTLERVLAIREKAYGPEHPLVANTVGSLGSLAGERGNYPEARRLYERAVAIREKALGPDHPQLAAAYDNLSQVQRLQGEFEGARASAARGLALRERVLGPDDPMIANSALLLGLSLWHLGRYSEAQPLYERAVRIRERASGPADPEYARAVNNLANILRDSGDFAAARPLYERALAIREKALGPNHPDVGNSLTHYASLLEYQGDFARARRFLERATAIREQASGPESPAVAVSLWPLARIMEKQGDYAAARPAYERALAIREKRLGPDHPDVAQLLNSFAYTLAALGDTTALSTVERAVRIVETALGPEADYLSVSLQSLTDLRLLLGDPEGARAAAERCLSILRKRSGGRGQAYAGDLYRLAQAEAAVGRTSEALAHSLEAERMLRDHVRVTARALAEREALRYSETRSSCLDLVMTLAARGLDEPSRRQAFDALIQSRALVLDEMAARHAAVAASGDTALARRWQELARARERLAGEMVQGASGSMEDYEKHLDELRLSMEAAERSLSEASDAFARSRSRARVDLDQVSANLAEGSALLAFAEYSRLELSPPPPGAPRTRWTDSRHVIAFVLRAGAATPEVVDLGPAEDLNRRVERWTRDASGAGLRSGEAAAERESRASGEALRQLVWDPIEPRLRGASRVLIVPDGALNLVNFAALPAREGGYLIERGPVLHIASAERDLVPSAASRRGSGLLAVGAVDFDARELLAAGAPAAGEPASAGEPKATAHFRGARSACGSFAAAQFEPLPATGAELREIARLWQRAGDARGEVATLIGPAASERAFKDSAPGRRVLHLATHGFALGRCEGGASTRGLGSLSETAAKSKSKSATSGASAGMGSAAIAAPAGSAPDTFRLANESPLWLSGLVLAGANRRAEAGVGEDDGILTAEEIASLDLAGTEWAVLSACESAVGDVRAGEGVLGLRRSFQIAGTGTLIASLWPVDDASTLAWMKSLYRARLERRLDTAASVHEASLEVLKQRRAKRQSTHPFYWAPFIASGDWR